MHCTDQCLYTDDEIHLLLESVHYHTMTVELLTRLLSYGTITTQNLLTKLKENVLFKEDISNITLNKDNQNSKLAYHKHIESLLDLQQLEPDTLIVLSVIALAPDSGFPIKLFYDWHGAYINELQILKECDLLVKNHQRLLLNPYLRKIINARKMLSLSQAPDFFATLLQMVSDSNHEHIQFALDILNTTLLFVNKNERSTWKKLVSHGSEISSQLHHYRLFQNSPSGLYTMTTYAKLLYQQKNFRKLQESSQAVLASRIKYTNPTPLPKATCFKTLPLSMPQCVMSKQPLCTTHWLKAYSINFWMRNIPICSYAKINARMP